MLNCYWNLGCDQSAEILVHEKYFLVCLFIGMLLIKSLAKGISMNNNLLFI